MFTIYIFLINIISLHVVLLMQSASWDLDNQSVSTTLLSFCVFQGSALKINV